MEQLDTGDCFEMNVECHICHHLARQILQYFPLIETFLSVPSKLAPGLDSFHCLYWYLRQKQFYNFRSFIASSGLYPLIKCSEKTVKTFIELCLMTQQLTFILIMYWLMLSNIFIYSSWLLVD